MKRILLLVSCLFLVLFFAVSCGPADKSAAPKAADVTAIVSTPPTTYSVSCQDVSKQAGDPTGEDAVPYRGRIWITAKARYFEAPSGCIIDISYGCGSYGPYPPGTGSMCYNFGSGGYTVFYSDCM